MKNLLVLIIVPAASYYIYTHNSPFQTSVTDPYYAEIRISIERPNIQLVGFGK